MRLSLIIITTLFVLLAAPTTAFAGLRAEGAKPECEKDCETSTGLTAEPAANDPLTTAAPARTPDSVRYWSVSRDRALDKKIDLEVAARKASDEALRVSIEQETYWRRQTDSDIIADQQWLAGHKVYLSLEAVTGPRFQDHLLDESGLLVRSSFGWNLGGDFFLGGPLVDVDADDGRDILTVTAGLDTLGGLVFEDLERCPGPVEDGVVGSEISPGLGLRLALPKAEFGLRGGYAWHTTEEVTSQGLALGGSAALRPHDLVAIGARLDWTHGPARSGGVLFDGGSPVDAISPSLFGEVTW